MAYLSDILTPNNLVTTATPGTAGQFLQSAGPGAPAQWVNTTGALTLPTLSAPASGNEGVTITVSITNYNASYAYVIAVTGGTYTRSGATILWTLPYVTADTVHYINVQATYVGSSSLFATANVTVNDIPLPSDTGISITDFNYNTMNDGWVI